MIHLPCERLDRIAPVLAIALRHWEHHAERLLHLVEEIAASTLKILRREKKRPGVERTPVRACSLFELGRTATVGRSFENLSTQSE
jgi:hypothetical protein